MLFPGRTINPGTVFTCVQVNILTRDTHFRFLTGTLLRNIIIG